MSDRYKKNMELREKIVDQLLENDDGTISVPQDPKMLSAINQLMQANDKVNMHQDRMKSDNDNAAMDREVALSISRATSNTSLRTRHDGNSATGSGPVAIGKERAIEIDTGTTQPLGGEINIDEITRLGRHATKGKGPDSED